MGEANFHWKTFAKVLLKRTNSFQLKEKKLLCLASYATQIWKFSVEKKIWTGLWPWESIESAHDTVQI